MDKKKSVILWENGKQVKLNINDTSEKSLIHRSGKAEQAASLQDSDDELIPTFARISSINSSNKKSKKQNKWKHFKPVIVAILSALVIGSFLGVMMLRMFVTIEGDLSANGNVNLPAANIDNTDDGEATSVETSTVMLDQIETYVLQGGVFSEKANADEWATTYQQVGLPTMIWERDNQFFLLIGLASTKDQAKQLTSELEEHEFDIFVKEWSTAGAEVELTEEEQNWLQSFQEQWNESLNSLTGEEIFQTASWEALVADYPDEAEKLLSLNKEIEHFYEDMNQAKGMEAQHILLNLWHEYEKGIK